MDDWLNRLEAVWADAEKLTDDDLLAAVTALAAERPADDARAAFELASANDSTGHELEAEPLYRRALAGDLPVYERGRATIQLASTVRNLGRPQESLDLLRAEFADSPDHPLADAATAFTALALADLGSDRRALVAVLQALARHLPRYTRSVTGYAEELLERGTTT